VRPATKDLVNLAASLDPPKQLEWSPDGTQAGYLLLPARGKPELLIVDATSGRSDALSIPEWVRYFHWAPSGEALLLANEHQLSWFDLASKTAKPLASETDSVLDAKVSPDGRRVSWVQSHNLHLMSVSEGRARAITIGGSDDVLKGELNAQYAAAFGLTTGYWWAPDSSEIAYLETDLRSVAKHQSVGDTDSSGKEQHYFLPGTPTPQVRILLASVSSGERTREVIAAGPKAYLTRVVWLHDSKSLAIERLNREQNEIELLIAECATGHSHTILTERDLYWINLPNDLYFFKDGRRFLWSSERGGSRHLYLYQTNGNLIKQITHGNWDVYAVSGVDEQRNVVYFTGSLKSPLESHLYRVPVDSGDVSPLTVAAGWHTPMLSPRLDRFLDTYSATTKPPSVDLLNEEGATLAHVGEAQAEQGPMPETLTIRLHDQTPLAAMMIKPPDFNATLKYPVIVYTYDGPDGRVVKNAWGGWPLLWHQFMAKRGYVILMVDARGSGGYGHLFEEPIHYRFGARELADLREVVSYLRELPFVDRNRLGIWGIGYGGHTVVHAMLEFSDGFKEGFADSPITDWMLSSGFFSEKYLGLLPQRAYSYGDSNAFDHAGALKGRLLVAANLYDREVHFEHILALQKELMRKGKSADVLVFPSADHVSDPVLLTALLERMTAFFGEL
jgi:dipeptidyl-peptidase-4